MNPFPWWPWWGRLFQSSTDKILAQHLDMLDQAEREAWSDIRKLEARISQRMARTDVSELFNESPGMGWFNERNEQ